MAEPKAEPTPTPVEATQQAFASAEAQYAKGVEGLVSSDSFSELLALVAGNTAAIVKKGTAAADAVVRQLRLAGRRDVVALSRQLARTEDKLERVLQEVEKLQDQKPRSRAKR